MTDPYDKEPRRLAAAAARKKIFAELGVDKRSRDPEVRAKVRAAVAAAVAPFIEAKDRADAELKEKTLGE